MKRIAAVLVVAGAVLGASACGDSTSARLSKHRYEVRMGTLTSKVLAGVDVKNTDFKDVPAYFRALARRFGTAAAEARAIKPPREVEDLHARIVDGMARAAQIVGKLADRLNGASVPQVKQLLRTFSSSSLLAALREVADAGRALAGRGYKISSSAGT